MNCEEMTDLNFEDFAGELAKFDYEQSNYVSASRLARIASPNREDLKQMADVLRSNGYKVVNKRNKRTRRTQKC